MCHLVESHRFIEEALSKAGSAVLIHCQAGVSRSVTLAASYLMKHHRLSAEDALAMIKSKRPAAKPISFFVEQLKLYEKEISSK